MQTNKSKKERIQKGIYYHAAQGTHLQCMESIFFLPISVVYTCSPVSNEN